MWYTRALFRPVSTPKSALICDKIAKFGHLSTPPPVVTIVTNRLIYLLPTRAGNGTERPVANIHSF